MPFLSPNPVCVIFYLDYSHVDLYDHILNCQKIMSSMITGNGVEQTTEMRYAELPEIFEDSEKVGSYWYTLAVRKPGVRHC